MAASARRASRINRGTTTAPPALARCSALSRRGVLAARDRLGRCVPSSLLARSLRLVAALGAAALRSGLANAARAALLADALEHRAALVVARVEQLLPPPRQRRIGLADFGAQAQEVEAGAKARLLEQRQRR